MVKYNRPRGTLGVPRAYHSVVFFKEQFLAYKSSHFERSKKNIDALIFLKKYYELRTVEN